MLHALPQFSRAADILYRSGTKPKYMIFVLSGELRLVRHTRFGAEVILQRVSRGFIAEASLESKLYHCNIEATKDSELIFFPLTHFKRQLEDNPEFRRDWMSLLAHEVKRLRSQCERLNLHSAKDRILHFLEAECMNAEFKLPHTKKAWAAELGLTHEVLYRTLKNLVNDKSISIDGDRIRIINKFTNDI